MNGDSYPPPPHYGGPANGTPYNLYGPYSRPGEPLPYEEGDPIPPGYHVKTDNYRGVTAAGAIIAGSAYQLSIATAAVGLLLQQEEAGFLFIPVAGPWILIPQWDRSHLSVILLATDGVLQAAGLGLMIGGLVAQDQYLVRSNHIAFTVAPLVDGDVQGAQLTGEF